MKKEYKKGNTTVVWQPELCIHSGVCFHSLPSVFSPLDRPWVKTDGGTEDEIKAAVANCPSGALSIKENEPEVTLAPNAEVKVFPNGPVRVIGACIITLADGTQVEKPNGVSFCRCGASSNKPFCDGTHKSNGFAD